MKILVTGGLGFVGSHVVDAYVKAGYAVVIVDDGRTGHNAFPLSVSYYDADINDPNIEEVIERERPDVINHLAANPSIPVSIGDPRGDLKVNVQGTLNLLRAAHLNGVKQFIFASSSEVYGATEAPHISEDTPLAPESPYAIGKMAAESYVRFYAKQYDMKATIFRYANIYGPRQLQEGGAVVAKFTHNLLNGIPVTLNNGGTATRDFVYVEDIARLNVMAIGHEGTFNAGSGYKVSIAQLLDSLEYATGAYRTARLVGTRPADFPASALSIKKVREEIEWVPAVSLLGGLHRTAAAQKALLEEFHDPRQVSVSA